MENPEENDQRIEPKMLMDEIDAAEGDLINLQAKMIEKTSEVGFALDRSTRNQWSVTTNIAFKALFWS